MMVFDSATHRSELLRILCLVEKEEESRQRFLRREKREMLDPVEPEERL